MLACRQRFTSRKRPQDASSQRKSVTCLVATTQVAVKTTGVLLGRERRREDRSSPAIVKYSLHLRPWLHPSHRDASPPDIGLELCGQVAGNGSPPEDD